MNLQRLIDQHPSVFAVIFPIYFLCLWLLVDAILSFIGGWFSLAKVYRTRVAFNGAKWRMQSGKMRWLANYNNVLTIGVSQQGLYLARSRLCDAGRRHPHYFGAFWPPAGLPPRPIL